MKIRLKKSRSKDNIRYICNKCNHIEYYSFGGAIGNLLLRVVNSLGLVFFVAAIFLMVTNPAAISVFAFGSIYKENPDIRVLGLNMAKGCRGDQYCTMLAVYDNLSEELDYSYPWLGKIQSPEKTLFYKSGDCKAMSALYVSLMANLGIKSYMAVNYEYEHAVAVVMPENGVFATESTKYYVVDLTAPSIEAYDKGIDFWDYYK